MSAVSEHDEAVNQRLRVQQSMGSRWNDVVYSAISRDVLNQVTIEERLYAQRLRDLERINVQAKNRLDVIRRQNLA
ncbi:MULTISPECIES: hypothetical protein [Gordonia]|uniref:hypothetical protein n=1 Tax=Gordonia TaxID=2053 RepID=UPI000B8DB06A|nr:MULTISPECIES: hypothetical protein [Gordonia]ASR05393.1 hypothetical protein GCWB2_23110 [Gordonia rubripertincta]